MAGKTGTSQVRKISLAERENRVLKNEELSRLNKDLIEKDSTIFSLRGKISELNNILSLVTMKDFDFFNCVQCIQPLFFL